MCNLTRKRKNYINVFAHNASNYDFNLILDGLDDPRIWKRTALAKNTGEVHTGLRFKTLLIIPNPYRKISFHKS